MKKLLIVLFVSISTLSCEKDNLIPKKDIPDWLKENIKALEQEIKADTTTISAYCVWVRYEWKNNYYFEFINPISSQFPTPKSMSGDMLDIYTDPLSIGYPNEKCCMRYVWKGRKQ
jgi:hypothetical protein